MLLSTLDEVDNVTHSQNTVSHRLGIEELDIVELLSHPFKLEGLARDLAN